MTALIIIGLLVLTSMLVTSKELSGGIILLFLTSFAFGVAFYKHMDEDTPKALDVYRGNTVLEITSVNGVPKDTVVIFKSK